MNKQIIKPDEIIISYIAGFMDGEGSIGIYRKKNNSDSKYYYRLGITIGNSDYEVLKWICDNLGIGKIYLKKKYEERFKNQYHWQVAGKEAEQFLQLIYPFLHIKKEECEIALEFRKLTSIKIKKISKENYMKREELAFKLSEIKNRTIKKCV